MMWVRFVKHWRLLDMTSPYTTILIEAPSPEAAELVMRRKFGQDARVRVGRQPGWAVCTFATPSQATTAMRKRWVGTWTYPYQVKRTTRFKQWAEENKDTVAVVYKKDIRPEWLVDVRHSYVWDDVKVGG